MDAVVAQEVGVGLDRAQIVDRHDFDIRAAVLGDGAQDEAADTAKAVDGDAKSHGGLSLTIRTRPRGTSVP